MRLIDFANIFLGLYREAAGHVYKAWFSRLPLEDAVVFSNFTGKAYGDNPRYISEELHRTHPEIKQIWIEKRPDSLKTPDYVTKVPLKSMARRRAYATSKVWVDSHSLQLDTIKRKGQFFIETWHGSFQIKKIEGDADMPLYYMRKTHRSANQADLFISNSNIKTEIYRRAFGYKGKVLECGYPKNDVFFGDLEAMRKEITAKLGIDNNKKLMIYAPTFRDLKNDWYDMDFARVKEALTKRFGGEWVILVRLHPVTGERGVIKVKECEYLKDVTKYPNMQELLLASDVYVTDYSSAVYDFSLMKRPAFLYASDMEDYRKERDLYWDIEKDLPFSLAENMDDFVDNIAKFDEVCYNHQLELFFDKIGPKETGHAAQTVAKLIAEQISHS